MTSGQVHAAATVMGGGISVLDPGTVQIYGTENGFKIYSEAVEWTVESNPIEEALYE